MASPVLAATSSGKQDLYKSGKQAGRYRGESREGATAGRNYDIPSLRSTKPTNPPPSNRFSIDRGSASIIEEPEVDCSSLPADTSHSSIAAPSHDMAGLPLFGGTFRHWMTGGTTSKPNTTDTEAHAPIESVASTAMKPHTRVRQPGIRECTDESCDLPRSDEIIQHLAESYREDKNQGLGPDGRRLASGSSAVTHDTFPDGYEATQHAYNSIEAEIDRLKGDVMRLREEADHGRTAPKTEQELASDRFLSTRSNQKQPLSTESASESAATRLQRLHEGTKSDSGTELDKQALPQQSLSPLDFPALSESKSESKTVSPVESESQPRKISYADAATNGMIDGLDGVFSAAMNKRANAMISDSASDGPLSPDSIQCRTQTSSTAATQCSSEIREDEDYSVIISPRSNATDSSANDPVMVSNSQQSAKNGKPAKQAPRFAQPTQSFSRRTGETMRAGSSPVSQKSSPGGSPTKTVKAKEPNLATHKRAAQRQQKRKSLPGDWFGAGGEHQQDGKPKVASKAGNEPASTPQKHSPSAVPPSPSSAERWQIVEGYHSKDDADGMQKQPRDLRGQNPACQKKSYMAPTNATKQRTIATVGEEKTKQDLPQAQTVVSQTDNVHGSEHFAVPHRSSTFSSETSSVQFILDNTLPALVNGDEQSRGNAQDHRGKHNTSHQVQTSLVKASPKTTASPVSANTKAWKSPGRKMRADRTNQTPTAQGMGKPSSYCGALEALPGVANTTTKRRTSHGHLLIPIFERLDSEGLLNKSTSNSATVEPYLKSRSPWSAGNAARNARKRMSDPSNRLSEEYLSTSGEINGQEPSKKTGPPYVDDSRQPGNVSTSTDDTLCVDPKLTEARTAQEQSVSDLASSPAMPVADAVSSAYLGGQNDASTPAQAKRVSSLRATASEFKPTQPQINDLDPSTIQAALQYQPQELWMSMSPAQRNAVRAIREQCGRQVRYRPRPYCPPFGTFSVDSSAMDKRMQRNMYEQNSRSVDLNGSPHAVQAGQVLTPSLSPGKKNVQWVLRNLDGKETPIKFGRAPAPHASPIFGPSTPTMSPTSDDTSPSKTPQSLTGWHIGSTYSRAPYGWTGGDGKEIKFVGYGPHAERDPNSSVNFNYQGRGGYNTLSSSIFGEDKENRPAESNVAPKSQRQWAEKFGYSKVPCGNVEITQAVEYCTPFGSQLAGNCHDCMANR